MSWVIDDAPVPTALFPVLMVIARRCDEHGRGSYQSVPTIAEKTGKSPDQVKRDIRDLKKLGLLLPGDDGLVNHIEPWKRPQVYDVPLHVSGAKPVKESKNKAGVASQGGGMDAPPGMDATGWHSARQGGCMDAPGGGCMDAPQTKPLKNKKNNPSLSRSDGNVAPATIPAQRAERENEEDSQEPKTHTPIHRLLLDAGCPPEDLDDVEVEMTRRHEPRSPAWWRTVAKAGDLAGLVGEVLEALQPAGPDLTDEHLADAHTFEAKGDGSPSCKHCLFPEQNGRHRASGYVSARAVSLDASKKRSTGALRAEQGLRVADELDRQFGHGRWAPGVIRSTHEPYRNPADDSVYDTEWEDLRRTT